MRREKKSEGFLTRSVSNNEAMRTNSHDSRYFKKLRATRYPSYAKFGAIVFTYKTSKIPLKRIRAIKKYSFSFFIEKVIFKAYLK